MSINHACLMNLRWLRRQLFGTGETYMVYSMPGEWCT